MAIKYRVIRDLSKLSLQLADGGAVMVTDMPFMPIAGEDEDGIAGGRKANIRDRYPFTTLHQFFVIWRYPATYSLLRRLQAIYSYKQS